MKKKPAKRAFKIGDVVQLKSGGAPMVVEGYKDRRETETNPTTGPSQLVAVSGWAADGSTIIDASYPEACLCAFP